MNIITPSKELTVRELLTQLPSIGYSDLVYLELKDCCLYVTRANEVIYQIYSTGNQRIVIMQAKTRGEPEVELSA